MAILTVNGKEISASDITLNEEILRMIAEVLSNPN